MAKNYHFLQGTNVVGPLQYDRLAKLVQDGVVSERTMLSDDASNWKAAVELMPQLFSRPAAGSTHSTSGAERWYVQSNGQEYGPISYTELFGWVSSKRVVADTLIRKSETGAWQRADTVFPHLSPRAITPRAAKQEPAASPYSSLEVRGPRPEPRVSEPNPKAASADEGSGAALTVFGVIIAVAAVFLVVQGFIQLKAAFGFAGIIAVVMLIRFFMALGSRLGNSK